MNTIKENRLRLATLTNHRNKIMGTRYPTSYLGCKRNIIKILNRLIWDRSIDNNSKLARG